MILDSNAVFDWLIFEDPDLAPIAEAITSGKVRWIATRAMLDEADHVIDRGAFDMWQPRHSELRKTRDTWVELVDEAQSAEQISAQTTARKTDIGTELSLHCADPDDQKFIDLALRMPPSILITRDNALLVLSKRAASAGVIVARPRDWQADWISE